MLHCRSLAGLSLLAIPHVLSFSHTQWDMERRQSVPTNLPGNWSSFGCYTDNTGARTLTGASFTDQTNMTVENCIAFCDSKQYIFAGVEFSQECYCDDFIENSATNASITDCNLPCTGNADELCGGAGRLNIFWSGVAPPPPPSIPSFIGKWESLGCYSDNVDGQGRTLVDGVGVAGEVSLETCTSACFAAGMPFSGAEFADQCFCGTAISNGGAPTPIADCNMACAGNISEFCGGPNRLTLYNYTGTDLPSPPVGGGGGGNGGATGGVTAIATDLPSPWAYVGCFVDGANGRVLTTEINDNANMTMEVCVAACVERNFTIAGGEFSVQCFCGDEMVEGAVMAPDSDCNMACGGNSTQACGAGDRLSVYSTSPNITIFPVPTPQNTSLRGPWVYQGCLAEKPSGDGNVFPWQINLPTNNSATTCLGLCAEFGYTAGGMELGSQCYCGDVSDVVASGQTLQAESDCNTLCSGDFAHLCGSAFRIQLYYWTGPAPVWHTPEVTGRYEFFVPGLVVPLIATVGINNKVTFLEKFPSLIGNATGAYELDLSLVNNFSETWREMHVQSNVFCSGSIILPDKAGRQLNVAGWSDEATQGVRLYTPDGVPGVNGTNDWEENFEELSLQRPRWYPTAAVLPNGTVMVIGGETSANASPEPNVEILPAPEGGNVIFLDWLNRTDPNNLYPFVFVLPSGNLFVVYYNEARIIDAGTFDTIKTLPNIPASVSSFLGGRTYPLEGAAVIKPLKAPYTDPLEVLVCGGSTPGPGTALDNCVSIQPEVENPAWVIERMPSRRVMPCMVGLPDGTFLIMNGAVQGVAGFGLASEPNLGALLYDPSMPVNQRISILNTTIVARLYHSEAILLPDGRVLVSGSDPEDNGINPEEYRIEVYIPPYLSQGLTQPSFTITNTDWAYGSQQSITVTLHQGTTSTMKVSLIAATSSTHGNTMGSRTIFPAFSCSGTACTITAPPNAFVSPPGWHQLFVLDNGCPSHSTWVRIGGDPAQLGNWPDLPGFTVPGV